MTQISWCILATCLGGTALAAPPPNKPPVPMHSHSKHAPPETISWEAIDTNHDGLIQPDEMERYLNAEWAKAKSASSHHS